MKSIVFPLVSIVIPSKNEEKNIANCLESITYQTYPAKRVETIVVVNEDSTDKTRQIARKYTKNVFIKGVERSEPRNFGLNKAKGKYLIFLDADMILSPTVVSRAVEKLENSNLVALYISEIILGNSCFNKSRRFERSFYDETVIDCVRFIRKDIFEKVGGFDTTMTGPEDWDFDKKIKLIGTVGVLGNYTFKEIDRKLAGIDYGRKDLAEVIRKITDAALLFHNETGLSFKRFCSKKIYYSNSFAEYVKKWGKDDSDIRKQFGFGYRYFGVFFEENKWKRLLSCPMLAIRMYLFKIVFGVRLFIKYFQIIKH